MSQQINLFNPVFLKQERLFSARALGQALLLMACGLILLSVVAHYRIADTRSQAVAVAKRLESTRGQLLKMIEMSKPAERNASLDDDIRKLELRVAASKDVLGFLQKRDFGESVAYSDAFRGFSRKAMPGIWLTGFALSDGGQSIEISGRAAQPSLVPAYIRALGNDPAFKGKSFSSVMIRSPQVVPVAATADSAKAVPAAPIASVEFFLSASETVRESIDLNGMKSK